MNLVADCEKIDAEHNRWSDREAIAAVTLAVIGLLVTIITAVIFAYHNETPVVKASTRELTYIILFGMSLCYLTTFPLLAIPNKLHCSLSRILPGLSFSMIYAALLTKTNRIARILAGSKKRIRTGKSKWLSATAQVDKLNISECITFSINALSLSLCLVFTNRCSSRSA